MHTPTCAPTPIIHLHVYLKVYEMMEGEIILSVVLAINMVFQEFG